MNSSENMPPEEAADGLAQAVRALIERAQKGVLASGRLVVLHATNLTEIRAARLPPAGAT